MVVQRAALQKIEWCGKCPRCFRPSGKPKVISAQLNEDLGPHYHVEVAVDWCGSVYLRRHRALKSSRLLYQVRNTHGDFSCLVAMRIGKCIMATALVRR